MNLRGSRAHATKTIVDNRLKIDCIKGKIKNKSSVSSLEYATILYRFECVTIELWGGCLTIYYNTDLEEAPRFQKFNNGECLYGIFRENI